MRWLRSFVAPRYRQLPSDDPQLVNRGHATLCTFADVGPLVSCQLSVVSCWLLRILNGTALTNSKRANSKREFQTGQRIPNGTPLNNATSKCGTPHTATTGWQVRCLPSEGESSNFRLWLGSSSDRPRLGPAARHPAGRDLRGGQ
jgi:hypothetical protein